MKVLLMIVGVVLSVGYIGANIGNKDSAPAANAADAPRVAKLAQKGERIAGQIARLSELGLKTTEEGDLAGSCAVVDAQIRKVNQLGRVIEQLRPLTDAETMAKHDQNEIDLRTSIGNAEAACNSMGY
jgi:hypothetical protein